MRFIPALLLAAVLPLVQYHQERPHQGRGNVPLPIADADDPPLQFPDGEVVCRERLGGLLKRYYRAAA